MTTEGDAVASPPTGSADLTALKSRVESLSDQIRTLKSNGGDDAKDKIPPLVAAMLEAKKLYADNNGGRGVDGKPYEEPLSKAEKRKRAKGEKGAGPAVEKADPNSASSKKKAAKKAEAKAKKAAAKAAAGGGGGGGGGGPAPGGNGGGKPAAAAAKGSSPAKGGAPAKKAPCVAVGAPSASKLTPHQLAFNPNSALTDRPVVALTVACLTNTVQDYDIVGDHTRPHAPGLGLPASGGGGGEVVGDCAIARYVARHPSAQTSANGLAGSKLLGGDDPAQQSLVDSWVDYAHSVSKFGLARRVKAVSATLNAALAGRTYAVGYGLTLADLALFSALGFPSQRDDRAAVMDVLANDDCPTARWVDMLSVHPAVLEATQLAVGITQVAAGVADEARFGPPGSPENLDPLMSGMSALQGATPGNVVTRFPPEPSGYLHVGHAKAVLMNEYYARRYKGRLIVRFDDTNPNKEKEEFQSSIIEDLAKLGVKPDTVTFTSDYFDTVRGYAEYMINAGLAFMDDTPQEQMQKERMDRVESKHRNQSPQECMELFKTMCSGDEEGGKWCLRAKIDMSSVNGTMRDPVIYRQNLTPHHRSGTTYKAYPTYDLACPIVDSLEGVTHALRTTEYNDRDEQYRWVQRALGLRRVRIHSFARMNFVSTVLSKRKLTWFVENGHVTGWDDPRFPTVRGVVRLGTDVTALRNFICGQGASRRVVNMEWGKFWAENKKEIDKRAKRFMAVDGARNVKLVVTDGPPGDSRTYLSTDCHPKDPSLGRRIVRLAREVMLEKEDADGLEVGQNIVLMRWGVVKITKVEGGLEGVYVPDGDVKAAKPKLSWLADVPENIAVTLTEWDNHLISKEKLEETEDFKDFLNPHTMATTGVLGDPGLKNLREHDIIQLERRGYYRVDRPYLSDDKPLVLFMIPDGKKTSMSGMAGKLAHR